MTAPRDVEASAKAIVQEHGLPDCIINCAGEGEWLSVLESNPDHYAQTIASPYLATALTCKVFYDLMKERGSGHFIIVNSAAAYFYSQGRLVISHRVGPYWAFPRHFKRTFTAPTSPCLRLFLQGGYPYFSNNPSVKSTKIADWLIPTLTAQQVGQRIAKTVNHPKSKVLAPFMLGVLVVLNRFFQSFRWLLRITGYKRPYNSKLIWDLPSSSW